MRNLFLITVLIISGCSSYLPSKSREISDFIPKEKLVEEFSANFSWAKDNFPKNCRWEALGSIIDGDTIKTNKSGKIRMIGIDTPEIKSPYTEEERGGKEATAKIREILAHSKKVCLIHDKIGDTTDKYGRSLDYVFSEEGLDVNAEMIKTGFARWYSRFPYERKNEFKKYQDSAKKEPLGLWK